MVKEEILMKLNQIFIDELDNKDIQLSNEITAEDIPEWDSLSHIYLVVAIEKDFNIRFSSAAIKEWKCVGDIIQTIEQKNS